MNYNPVKNNVSVLILLDPGEDINKLFRLVFLEKLTYLFFGGKYLKSDFYILWPDRYSKVKSKRFNANR